MRRGPKSTPTALLLIEGGKRRGGLNPKEPTGPAGSPDMPEWLHPYAKEEWARIVPLLVRMGVISRVDRAAVAAYCQAYGRWQLAEEKFTKLTKADDATGGFLIKTQAGNAIQHPLLSVANAARRDVVRAAAELGLTPAARAQLTGDGGDDDEVSKTYNL